MHSAYTIQVALPKFNIWKRFKSGERRPITFDLEITARCNLNCRHCYINLPVNDIEAKSKELSFVEVERIADEALSLGAIWCLVTGGEPLLRSDFFDIYLCLKRKGFLVSVFTNATLITPQHISLFKKYPPRDIEVSVYGITKGTYERVTRQSGSFQRFMSGLKLLFDNKIKVRLKAMALRSNVHELPAITKFCRRHTTDYFRFDPFLHLRFDGNHKRNKEIKSERLDAAKIVEIEQRDAHRFSSLLKNCDKFIVPQLVHRVSEYLFSCGAGNGGFYVSYDGHFRLCSSLCHPNCVFDLRKGSLVDAYQRFVVWVRNMRSDKSDFLQRCNRCPIINLCFWCPAHAYLETGRLDGFVEYFCQVAQARKRALEKKKKR